MKTQTPKIPTNRLQRTRLYNFVFIPVALLILYVIVPQLQQFDSAVTAAKNANTFLIVSAGFCIVLSVMAAAAVYIALAQKPVRYRDSVVVQTAGMFVNRLLPAGIGGMGLSADFLYKHKHTFARSVAIVALNNTLTFAGHMLLLLVVFAAGLASMPDVVVPDVPVWAVGCVVVALGLTAALLSTTFLRKLQSFLVDFVRALVLYRTQKARVLRALGFALCNTLGHAAALFLCMQGFHLDLVVAVALIALSGGVAAASITPTPGGLLGSEAGITAVLISYDVAAGTALAVALSYRLVSYWLPLLPGALAFWYAGRRRII